MATKQISGTKSHRRPEEIAWPHVWLRSAMVGKLGPMKALPTKKETPSRRLQKLRRMKAALGQPRE
jgi:hypothetical protein